MEIRSGRIEDAVELIGDGGISECTVMVYGRAGGQVELNYQEWLRVGRFVSERYGMTDVADWQEPESYGDEVVQVP